MAEPATPPEHRFSRRKLLLLWLGCVAVLLPATAFWALRECGGDLTRIPGQTRDDVFYDSVAASLAAGRGFSLDFTEWDWLRPYRRAHDGIDRDWLFQMRARGPTTSRAPVYPLLLAASYRIAGRRWDVVRIAQIVTLPLGLAALLVWAGKEFGSPWLSLVAAGTLAGDFGVLATAGQIMSEAVGTILLAAVLATTCRAARLGTARSWIVAGMVFGLALLCRSTLSGWLAVAVPILFVVSAVRLILLRPVWPVLRRFAILVLATAIVCSPWWYRNIRRSGAFAPTGSAGPIGMAGGYCDGCLAEGGNWYLPAVKEAEAKAHQTPGFRTLRLAEQEHRIGEASEEIALEWILRNFDRLPQLAGLKAVSELGLIGHPAPVPLLNALLLGSAAVGCWLARRTFGTWIFVGTVLSTVTTMLTWAHYGRFSIPIRPWWHLASAVTVVCFWRVALGWIPRRGKVSSRD